MSAQAQALARGARREAPGFELRLAPREGWAAFALLVFMLLLLAWSVAAADYRGGDLGWLAWVMILGASWGLLAANARLPRWLGHPLGAVIGAGVVLVLTAGALSSAPDLGARLGDVGRAAVLWYRDVTGPAHLSEQNVAWQVTCGAVSWATAQYASYAYFGHRRPFAAIVIPGLLLVVNMVIAASVDLAFLVLYTAAALLLLVRTNLVEQREALARRSIGEAAGAGGAVSRAGAVLIAGTVAGAVFLSSVGSSAPLVGLWDVFQHRAGDVALRVNDWFNLSPAVRFHGDPFDTNQLITGEWISSTDQVARVVSSDNQAYYLRGAVYDTFVNGNRWVQSNPSSTFVDAGGALLGELGGDGDLALATRTDVTLSVTMLRDLRVVLSPAVPKSVSIQLRLDRLGDGGPFADLRPPGDVLPAGTTYQVVALVARPGDAGLTKNMLRAAGDAYPPAIMARYALVPSASGAFDPHPTGHESVAELAARLVDQLGLTNAFDIADAFQWYLSDARNFTYASNVRGKCAPGESVADCFLRIREGYCEYYATTMILMLRSQGIPARLAVGYLPPGSDGIVLSDSAHAWVEVYFPGYGWAPFDPTGGNGAAPVQYPEGAAAAPTPRPPGGRAGSEDAITKHFQNEHGIGAPGTAPRDVGNSLLPVAGLLVLALAAVAVLVWQRRRPRRQPDVVAVYGRLTRIAALLGFPPRPAQTVLEYTGSLAAVLPEARPELETVALAKVEATYRPVALGRDRLAAVAEAYRRLRLGLARLIWRRGSRLAAEARRSR